VALAFALITFLHVVFGELIPKTLALQTPDRTALWVAGPLNVFVGLSCPFILLMNGTGNTILRWWGGRLAGSGERVHSVEELSLLIEDTRAAGVLSAEAERQGARRPPRPATESAATRLRRSVFRGAVLHGFLGRRNIRCPVEWVLHGMQDRQGAVDVVRGVVQVRRDPQRPPPVRHLDPPSRNRACRTWFRARSLWERKTSVERRLSSRELSRSIRVASRLSCRHCTNSWS
jgi:hypothetical protein